MTIHPPVIPLSDVPVDEEILEAVSDVVASGWWSMGPRVAEFEEAFAGAVGSKHAFAVANGTAALHLALLAVEVGPGDEVVVPSLNFVAAANVVRFAGATPVFCDIRSGVDLNLDVADVEAAITDRTKAVIALHYGGFGCEIQELTEVAHTREIAVVEDAAHAPGARRGGRACGTFGEAGCFSFFANKNMPLGEGGMVVTDDDSVAQSIKLLRSHGMTTLTWDRHRGHAHTYDVVRPGLNYRLDEIRAAIGLVQLRRLGGENARRGELWERYVAALEGVEGLRLPFRSRPADEVASHHLAVVLLPDDADRDTFRGELRNAGIQTSVHYPPIHRFSAYESSPRGRALPETEAVAERLVTLPLFGTMTDEQFEAVATAIPPALEAARSRAGGRTRGRAT
jgi:dTDP-4-amino-4,6-dideoxygalactose transaminase